MKLIFILNEFGDGWRDVKDCLDQHKDGFRCGIWHVVIIISSLTGFTGPMLIFCYQYDVPTGQFNPDQFRSKNTRANLNLCYRISPFLSWQAQQVINPDYSVQKSSSAKSFRYSKWVCGWRGNSPVRDLIKVENRISKIH